MEKPVISIVVVVDREGDSEAGWEELRATLFGLSRQDFDGPVEILLVENDKVAVPSDLSGILPGLELVKSTCDTSYGLKNAGVKAASADLVGILDGDCVPGPGWIREAVSSLTNKPDFAVVSGRTLYPGQTILERICCLIDRSHLDRGVQRQTDSIAVNNSCFRKSTLLKIPFPDLIGAFGERIHVESFSRSGLKMLFSPGMEVTHTYLGWQMERDIRRNLGYATIKVRQIDPRIRFSSITRMGYLAIPFFLFSRTLYDCLNSVRWGRYYGVPWYYQPLSMAVALLVHTLEVPGMLSALREEGLGATSFR